MAVSPGDLRASLQAAGQRRREAEQAQARATDEIRGLVRRLRQLQDEHRGKHPAEVALELGISQEEAEALKRTSMEELAQLVGVTRATLYNLLNSG